METNETKTDLKPYLWGFFLSVALTLISYILVDRHLLSTPLLVAAIVILGAIQTVVQLVLFLHLGQEKKPHWNLMTFFFMFVVTVVIVAGSLWIMYSLEYTLMPNMDMSL
jgi:cytochrome o ubiquinol oxidase operon protein cyoD